MTERPIFDVIVLTAANEAQAVGYRAQLAEREKNGLLPRGCVWRVVSDPGGRRVGSGGSTLQVLSILAQSLFLQGESFAARFHDKRVLIVHSGGDARRIPAYAALGKSFLPMPCHIKPLDSQAQSAWQQHPAALFDLLLNTLSRLPRAPGGEVLVCSGDVLLTFDAGETDLHTPGGITGLGFAATTAVGRQHGVYLTQNSSVGGEVKGFLQKPSPAAMIEKGAVDSTGRILVDSGVLSLTPPAVGALLEASGLELSSRGVQTGLGLYHEVLDGHLSVVDLYQEIALALPKSTTHDAYLLGVGGNRRAPQERAALSEFWTRLRDFNLPFHVATVANGEFFHIGTTRDLLGKFAKPSLTTRAFAFQNGFATRVPASDAASAGATLDKKGLTVFNAVLNPDALHLHGQAFIEGCEMGDSAARARLGGENVFAGVMEAEWKEAQNVLDLQHWPRGIGLTCLPMKLPTRFNSDGSECFDRGMVPLLFGADDDFKAPFESGACKLLNQPLRLLLEAGVPLQELWPQSGALPEERSAWTARLWSMNREGWQSLAFLLRALQVERSAPIDHSTAPEPASAATGAEAKADAPAMQAWLKQKRWSLNELLRHVDHDELLRRRRRLMTRTRQADIFDLLLRHDDLPIAEVATFMAGEDGPGRSAALLLSELLHRWEGRGLEGGSADESKTDSAGIEVPELSLLTQARLQRAAGVLSEMAGTATPMDAQGSAQPAKIAAVDWNRAALVSVARAVESVVETPHQPSEAAILHDQAVWVTAPARIDFAGGWSDTPPICLERGGTVLNAAVTLNNQYPIQVVAKLNDEGCIRLTSIDLGRQEIYRDAESLNGPPDLNEWSSLAKAALVMAGIAPERDAWSRLPGAQGSLRHWLNTLGGGLDLTLFSGLPKGSGMGTSSILGASVLACLARVLGREMMHDELIAQTTLLEQRMTSGGGWQDQVGGIVGGVKLIRTQPGLAQHPALQWTVFGGTARAAESLRRRMLLYFTGHKRVARHILRHVLGRYLAREPEMLRLIERLKIGAENAKAALEANDPKAFDASVAEYWELKKAVDEDSTNADIEAIFDKVSHLTSVHSLCGAGGGGFLLLIAHDEDAAVRIRHILNTDPPNPQARFFDFAIDPQGLAVTVL